jgi:hypothetical protein
MHLSHFFLGSLGCAATPLRYCAHSSRLRLVACCTLDDRFQNRLADRLLTFISVTEQSVRHRMSGSSIAVLTLDNLLGPARGRRCVFDSGQICANSDILSCETFHFPGLAELKTEGTCFCWENI